MKNYKTFIAIDPGRSNGSIVVANDIAIHCFKMPKTASDINALFINNIKDPENTLCFIERISLFSGDVNIKGKIFRMQPLLANSEQLKTILVTKGIDTVHVPPQTWQKTLNLVTKEKEEKPERKKRYCETARAWYPHLKVSLWNCDALLILRFMMYKKNDPKWIAEKINNNL